MAPHPTHGGWHINSSNVTNFGSSLAWQNAQPFQENSEPILNAPRAERRTPTTSLVVVVALHLLLVTFQVFNTCFYF